MADKGKILQNLMSKSNFKKVSSLKKLIKLEKTSEELVPAPKNLVPLHFTSNAYYSLYSPTVCAYMAHKCGCTASSINDFATLRYSKEFKRACRVLSMQDLYGYHINCKPLFGEKVGKYYAYGITYKNAKLLDAELKKYRDEKKALLVKVIKRINKTLNPIGITILEKEVFTSSQYKDCSITEKHVAKILASKIIDKFKKPLEIIEFLKVSLAIDSCEGDLRFLKEQENSYFLEDLAKVLYNKYTLLQPKERLEDAKTFIELGKKYGAISSYKINITSYDEEFLSNTASVLLENGFNAVTIKFDGVLDDCVSKVVDYFYDKGILAVSLYRIGLPRQLMPTKELSEKLYNNAMAIVGSSVSSLSDIKDSFFGENTIKLCPNLLKRVEIFSNIAKKGN